MEIIKEYKKNNESNEEYLKHLKEIAIEEHNNLPTYNDQDIRREIDKEMNRQIKIFEGNQTDMILTVQEERTLPKGYKDNKYILLDVFKIVKRTGKELLDFWLTLKNENITPEAGAKQFQILKENFDFYERMFLKGNKAVGFLHGLEGDKYSLLEQENKFCQVLMARPFNLYDSFLREHRHTLAHFLNRYDAIEVSEFDKRKLIQKGEYKPFIDSFHKEDSLNNYMSKFVNAVKESKTYSDAAIAVEKIQRPKQTPLIINVNGGGFIGLENTGVLSLTRQPSEKYGLPRITEHDIKTYSNQILQQGKNESIIELIIKKDFPDMKIDRW